jgi:O-antigen ligase
MCGSQSSIVKPFRSRSARHLEALVFSLTIAGYPVAGLAAAGFDLSSVVLSTPFRLLVFALASLLLLKTVTRCAVRLPTLVVVGFWSAYLLRLSWDTFAADLDGAGPAMVFFLATVVVPCLALISGTRYWYRELAARWLFVLGGVVCFGALALEWVGFAGNRSLTQATSRLSTDTVNPITLGHVAVSTILAAYALLEEWTQFSRRLAILVVAGIAFICLIETGSKGPLLSLVVAAGFLMVGRISFTRLALVGGLASAALFLSDTPLLGRLSSTSEDQSTIERLDLAKDAFEQAASNPWLGSATLEVNSQAYPHNLMLEAMMAVGTPAGLLFATLCAYGLAKSVRIRRTNAFLGSIFIQYLVAGFFSGSLYGSASFWASLVLVSNLPRHSQTTRTKRQDAPPSEFLTA